jgi:hypothetical protein
MKRLIVWAPNAQGVELVNGNQLPFNPPIFMVGTFITYKNTDISGYWGLPPGINFPLNDGDGYWFKITFKSGEVHYRIDPYSRALQHSESYSIYGC